jgi:hypothetical protein
MLAEPGLQQEPGARSGNIFEGERIGAPALD